MATKKKYYYKIDLIDPDDECTGRSLVVSVDGTMDEDSIIQSAIGKNIVDREDTEEFRVKVEDITGDKYTIDAFREETYTL